RIRKRQTLASPVSEELENAQTQTRGLPTNVRTVSRRFGTLGSIRSSKDLQKTMSTLGYQIDQLELVLEKIDKVKEEAL
ncbi:hypothetical protein KI387_014843, partial [Taxus chinensis]